MPIHENNLQLFLFIIRLLVLDVDLEVKEDLGGVYSYFDQMDRYKKQYYLFSLFRQFGNVIIFVYFK